MNININDYETLFLDRDGVINKLHPGDYIKNWNEFEFLPNVLDMLSFFNRHFKHILIVTNQRGVGKGLMSESALNEIHERMIAEITKSGGRIDKVYYCTAISENDHNRKPNIGMALQAKKDFPDIDFSKSMMIGDSESDRLFAHNLGMIYLSVQNDLLNLFRSFL
jgi:histidinol-phosphate phosphatase family protein